MEAMSKQRREKQAAMAAAAAVAAAVGTVASAREPFMQFTSGCNPEGKPFVHVAWGDQKQQLSPDQSRDLGRILFEVAEAAEMDATLFGWVAERFPTLELSQRAQFIADLRRHREAARAAGEAGCGRIEVPVPLDPREVQ